MSRYCPFCEGTVEIEADESNGFTCCTACGAVLDDNVFSTDPTFTKANNGMSQVDGSFVPMEGAGSASAHMARGLRGARIFGYSVDSHEKTISKGKFEVTQIADRLGIRPREEISLSAHRLYKLAVQRNFTRGRKTQQVAGACLYIICRQENKPYMLIDFSDALQSSVYQLGATFLQLCKLLRLEQHPIVTKPVDPSLFIHRFADRLNLGKKFHVVSETALRLVGSMKRDWLHTGRRPSGICGAALYLAAHTHAVKCTKSDIVQVVHVAEATIKKRLAEFTETQASLLTPGALVKAEIGWGEEKERREVPARRGTQLLDARGVPQEDEQLGTFVSDSEYQEFVSISGGLHGGSLPPSFKVSDADGEEEARGGPREVGQEPPIAPVRRQRRPKAETHDEDQEETFSDIDDGEVDIFMHSAEESKIKSQIWLELNKDYLEDQSQKAVAALSSGAKEKKDKAKRKSKEEKQSTGNATADSAAEATMEVLKRKKLSSKINYAALESLFSHDKKDTAKTERNPAEVNF